MLLCGIINALENITGTPLSYFFCQTTDYRINTAQAVVGGLLRFFLERRRTLLEHVSETFKDKLDQLIGPNAWEVLCDIFEMVVQEPSLPGPICIVDALDECEHDCGSLLKLIVKTSPHVKWLISSRNTKDIERKLQSIDPSRRLSLELGGNAVYVSHSVDAYINRSIHNIEALEHDENLRAYTTNILKSKANGTYLWVSLVVGQLQNTDHRNIKHILNKIPEGLENLYSLIMTQSYERLGQEDREAYPIILSTVATAKRPLLLEELFTFVKFQWEYSDNIYSIRDIQDMVKDCAKDFMMHNALDFIFPSGIIFQHSRMFQASLHTLSTLLKYNIYNLKAPGIGINGLSLPCPDPLAPIAYCCVFWVEHLVHSCESNKSELEKSEPEELFKNNGLIHSFLKDKYLCWLEALALLRKLTPQGVDAVHKVKRLVSDMADLKQRSGTSCLRAFADDAYRFVLQYKDTVSKWPLQLYYSAMVFDDKNSVTYKTFQQTIRTEFSNTPTLINRPQRWLSLQEVVEANGNDHSTWSLLFSPDSTLLGSLSGKAWSPRFSLWKTDLGDLKRVIEINPEYQYEMECPYEDLDCYVAFTPDLQHLVSVSSTGVVQKWAINSGYRIECRLLPLETCIYHFVPKEVGYAKTDLLRERVVALSQNGDLDKCLLQTSTDENFVAFSPYWSTSSFVLASYSSSETRLWQIDASNTLDDMNNRISNQSYVTISPNSKLLAVMDKEEHNVKIWSANSGKCILVLDCPALGFEPIFSHNSRLLACSKDNEGDIGVWRINTGKCIHTSRGGGSLTSEVVFSPDSKIIAYIHGDVITPGDVCVWHISTGKFSRLLDRRTSIRAVFSGDSRHLFLADRYKGRVWIYCMESDQCVYQYTCQDDWELYSDRIIISPCSTYIAGESKRRHEVQVWDWRMDHCASLFNYRSSTVRKTASSLSFSSDSTVLAVVCRVSGGYEIQIWEVATSLCLTRVAVEDDDSWRYHEPSFGLTEGCINTFCGSFVRKESSWEHCVKSLQPRYYIEYADGTYWAYCGREKVSVIPEELHSIGGYSYAEMPSPVLAYVYSLLQLTIIKFPSGGKREDEETEEEEDDDEFEEYEGDEE
ncbi:hypothetical protein MKX08_005640 [Trichoderma sp. CBMAI-0020]|nr:hypothetical protein MKX08_005640 [Trichoderma sp. CBMAI-0020]